ncbi:MAG: 3D domain-containing protein [Clostridia bacterium]|nr:3D domain-containing protein [Clostridia bacterium]
MIIPALAVSGRPLKAAFLILVGCWLVLGATLTSRQASLPWLVNQAGRVRPGIQEQAPWPGPQPWSLEVWAKHRAQNQTQIQAQVQAQTQVQTQVQLPSAGPGVSAQPRAKNSRLTSGSQGRAGHPSSRHAGGRTYSTLALRELRAKVEWADIQPLVVRKLSMEATAYTHTGNRTAAGVWPCPGVIAVDPRVIPLGTWLYVEGYGLGQALDTGGLIKGRRIDLFMDSEQKAVIWGRRSVQVCILRPLP